MFDYEERRRLTHVKGAEGSLFEAIGGRETLERVHKIFYDDVYEHPWLGKFFAHREQRALEDQQSDFMSGNFGGPKVYGGRMPQRAHEHMMISQELFDLRQEMLSDAIKAVGVADELRQKWLRIDAAFAPQVVKQGRDECKKRFATDDIIDFAKP